VRFKRKWRRGRRNFQSEWHPCRYIHYHSDRIGVGFYLRHAYGYLAPIPPE
jgi:hypothetical protein